MLSLTDLVQLAADELVAAVLEALDDLTDQATVDTVGLDNDEGAFTNHDCCCFLLDC